jgi:hypothetical protein
MHKGSQIVFKLFSFLCIIRENAAVILTCSVADPEPDSDPQNPCVFGPPEPGAGSISKGTDPAPVRILP